MQWMARSSAYCLHSALLALHKRRARSAFLPVEPVEWFRSCCLPDLVFACGSRLLSDCYLPIVGAVADMAPGRVYTPVGLDTMSLGPTLLRDPLQILPGVARRPVTVCFYEEALQKSWWWRGYVRQGRLAHSAPFLPLGGTSQRQQLTVESGVCNASYNYTTALDASHTPCGEYCHQHTIPYNAFKFSTVTRVT